MAITQIRIDLFRVCFLPTAFSKAIAINVDARIIKIKKKKKRDVARFRVASRWHAVKATRAVFFSDTQSWPAGMGYIVARFSSLSLSLSFPRDK